VIHAPFGGRINKAWGLALRKRFCRSFNFELQAAATDNGLNISLAEQHSFPLADVFHFLHTNSVQHVLEQAVLPAPVFGSRWRWDASRSLALIRFRHGKRVPLHIQRMQSDDLLASVFPDAAACPENLAGDIEIPDHPLVRETMKDVLTEAMDIDGLKEVLEGIADGRIRCVAVDTPIPSVFSHEILNANPYAYLDDAPLEERRARAVEMRRTLPASVLEEVGRLDPAAIAEVQRDAWPDVRDADELSDALQSLVMLPAQLGASWAEPFEQLVQEGRATRATAGDRVFWVPAERSRTVNALHPGIAFDVDLADVETTARSREEALLAIVQGWMAHVGPTTAAELANTLGLPESDVDGALLRLEAAGSILRGSFRERVAEPVGATPNRRTEWCERRLLARIHRLTLGRLRREIEPVTAARFMRWLFRWQHLAPGTQLSGERGTLEVLGQLQGFEAPANAWEPQLLARRLVGYDPAVLDQLSLTGAIGWGRLSPHPAIHDPAGSASGLPLTPSVARRGAAPSQSGDGLAAARPFDRPKRRVVPTSVAPITFFIRDDAEWTMRQRAHDLDQETAVLSDAARQVLGFLKGAGASFFADIVRSTRRLKSEVEAALWELVAAGVVTADGFDNLRALIDPRRRAGHGSGRAARPRHSTGRWSLLHTGDAPDRTTMLEACCRMLLRRYGIVFRELLARETMLPKWRELLITFRRLEDRGEIRGGRFVDGGFIGEQFALPIAVESLRADRHAPLDGQTVTIAAADPLNLVGVIVPGDRVAAVSGRFVRWRDGVPIGEAQSAPTQASEDAGHLLAVS